MSEAYARDILRRNIAQICQTIGWNGINSTPLDVLVHVLEKYIRTIGTQTHRYAEQFNRTEPNLHDLGLVFRDLQFNLPELAEYTRCVVPVPPPVNTERFPKPKESNLNFLKPGSHEVVTRPMHVNEHLPPMYPEKERDAPAVVDTVEIQQNGIDNIDNGTANCMSPDISVTDSPEKSKELFKRPTDPVILPNHKRPRLRVDEEERTREISSVMMTMSGFISPAREGRLPEARPPVVISDKHEKHKTNSHHTNLMKVPMLEKIDKKSKKHKLLNGKIMKNKRKDKSHKSDSSKSKDSSKAERFPPGYPVKTKDVHPTHHNHVTMPAPKMPQPSKSVAMPAPLMSPRLEPAIPIIKQELIDPPLVHKPFSGEDAIPVPRKIPISKSPLVSNSLPLYKHQPTKHTLVLEREIKKEVKKEDEKLASQPDRSKINIFKKISNKSKEDKSSPEVVPTKLQSEVISRLQEPVMDGAHEHNRVKPNEPVMNNNNTSALDLSKEVNLRSNEVISLDEDSLDVASTRFHEPHTSLPFNKFVPVSYPKDLSTVGSKLKKDKKHKEKKDKSADKVAKLIKKQQQQLTIAMQQEKIKAGLLKLPKSNRPKSDPKIPPMPPGFPFFSSGLPTPGLIPNPGLIPGGEYFANLANNPALRGLPGTNLMTNPFALTGRPGIIQGPSFMPSSIPTSLLPSTNISPMSKSSRKIPPILRRPSLEVIPVDNDRDMHKSPITSKDRHKISPTIPNILQKHKTKSNKDHHKSNLYKMPPVHPDITIELNPPRVSPERSEVRELRKEMEIPQKSPTPPPLPTPIVVKSEPVEPKPEPDSLNDTVSDEKLEKKKDKSHKKEKKDKEGLKIKKKKDKKDKNKDKSEKKREKEEKAELKEKIKKEKKEKKKEKPESLVPKLMLKLNSNSNSPMPPSSPDVVKLNIKPIVKNEEEEVIPRGEAISGSRSPELAQISALVTRPPKPRRLVPDDSPPSPRRSRPPSTPHSKHKRILIKPLGRRPEPFEEDEDPVPVDATATSAPAPFYVDAQGNRIWVCPACGKADNGSPMIGCDDCDCWYHWECVGILEEPSASDDWFCAVCRAKRAASLASPGASSARKRGRKPKHEKS